MHSLILCIGQIGVIHWGSVSRGYMHAAAHTALCCGHDTLTGQVLMLCRGSRRRQMPCRSPLPVIPSHGTGSGGQLSASCRKHSLAYMATSKIWCVVVYCKLPPKADAGQLCLFGRVVWSCPCSCTMSCGTGPEDCAFWWPAVFAQESAGPSRGPAQAPDQQHAGQV